MTRWLNCLGRCLLLAGACLAGCEQRRKPLSTGAYIESYGQLENRRQNAEQITNWPARNDALRNVALDAAGQGVGEVAISATARIDRQPLRDQTAEQCARLLDDRAERSAAERLADSIGDPTTRDRLRSYLAGRTPPSAR